MLASHLVEGIVLPWFFVEMIYGDFSDIPLSESLFTNHWISFSKPTGDTPVENPEGAVRDPKIADLKNPCISREVPFHLHNIRSIPTCGDIPKLPYKVSNRACVAEEFVIQRYATGTCRHHTTAIWTMTRKTPSGTLMTGNPPAFLTEKADIFSHGLFSKSLTFN